MMTTRDELLAEKRPASGLQKIINDSPSIDVKDKLLYIELAKDFDSDFEKHLFATSLDLNRKFPFGLDAWQTFLTQPQISRYIAGFTQEILEKGADANIMAGTNVRDAAHIKKQLAGGNKGQNNFGFVIMYIPEEEDRNYESLDTTGED